MNTLTPEQIDEATEWISQIDAVVIEGTLPQAKTILIALEMAKGNIDKLFQLKQLTDVQCDDGNWNYDPYMHGMANGMIFSQSVMEGCEPKYKDAPDTWLAKGNVWGDLLPLEIVQGDSMKRLNPHAGQLVNSNEVWFVTQPVKNMHTARELLKTLPTPPKESN